MRIHHLNCGTMCPYGGQLMGRPEPGLGPAPICCHCLLIESDHGLVLVDTGIGMRDVEAPVPRLSRFFMGLMRPRLDPNETAIRQVARLGFAPADVRHIVLTHLDFDHAGGLQDFPHARVHVLADELEAARHRVTPIQRGRYRPPQWPPPASWEPHAPGGEPWFGFSAVRALPGLPPEILMVPLVGHTLGHSGVAVDTGAGWLLHAGDAYFYRGEMNVDDPRCPAGLRMYQTMMEQDRAARHHNQQRLRDLIRDRGGDVRVLCAHDPVEFAAWSGRATSTAGDQPAAASP